MHITKDKINVTYNYHLTNLISQIYLPQQKHRIILNKLLYRSKNTFHHTQIVASYTRQKDNVNIIFYFNASVTFSPFRLSDVSVCTSFSWLENSIQALMHIHKHIHPSPRARPSTTSSSLYRFFPVYKVFSHYYPESSRKYHNVEGGWGCFLVMKLMRRAEDE